MMLTYEKLGDLGLSGRLYRFSDDLTVDGRGRVLDRPVRYVVVSDSVIAVETCVFPVYLRDGYTESDLISGARESATMSFGSIAGDGNFEDDCVYLDRLVEVNQ